MIISLISSKFIIQIKLGDYKVSKINEIMGLSSNHVFLSKNDNNYYISMNLKIFVNAIK